MSTNIKIQKAINMYNSYFWLVILITFLAIVSIGGNLYLKRENDDGKWYSFRAVLKREVIQMIVFGFIVYSLFVFLKEGVSINVVELLQLSEWWKIIFGIWIMVHIISGKELYRKLRFSGFLKEVKNGDYKYTNPVNVFMDIIERYNANYIIQTEKLGILKSLTPISLLPLIAGYILEGKNIKVNWNWYTIAFFTILAFYLYNLWKCYKNIKFWRLRMVEIQRELRDFQIKEDPNGGT